MLLLPIALHIPMEDVSQRETVITKHSSLNLASESELLL